MSNETKRDVFEDAAFNIETASPDGPQFAGELRQRYDAALPDDRPVIPKDVSEWLTWCKRKRHSLKDALDGETRVSEETFARAWVLGVWSVEETGEIVKLEAKE